MNQITAATVREARLEAVPLISTCSMNNPQALLSAAREAVRFAYQARRLAGQLAVPEPLLTKWQLLALTNVIVDGNFVTIDYTGPIYARNPVRMSVINRKGEKLGTIFGDYFFDAKDAPFKIVVTQGRVRAEMKIDRILIEISGCA